MSELVLEFVAEANEGLNELDIELIRLEQDPSDKEILGHIFRIMHTIKGTCGFLGLSRLEKLAHAAENVLGEIREGKLEATPEAISLVLMAVDSIKGILIYLTEHAVEPEGDDADLVGKLNQFAGHGGSARPSPPSAEAAATPVAAPAKADVLEEAIRSGLEIVEEKPAPAPQAAPTPAAPAAAAATAGGKEVAAANQSIRVNLLVLESMMQMVSELVLTRNQLLQIMRRRDDEELAGPMHRLNFITSELQDNVMQTRMQPISSGTMHWRFDRRSASTDRVVWPLEECHFSCAYFCCSAYA